MNELNLNELEKKVKEEQLDKIAPIQYLAANLYDIGFSLLDNAKEGINEETGEKIIYIPKRDKEIAFRTMYPNGAIVTGEPKIMAPGLVMIKAFCYTDIHSDNRPLSEGLFYGTYSEADPLSLGKAILTARGSAISRALTSAGFGLEASPEFDELSDVEIASLKVKEAAEKLPIFESSNSESINSPIFANVEKKDEQEQLPDSVEKNSESTKRARSTAMDKLYEQDAILKDIKSELPIVAKELMDANSDSPAFKIAEQRLDNMRKRWNDAKSKLEHQLTKKVVLKQLSNSDISFAPEDFDALLSDAQSSIQTQETIANVSNEVDSHISINSPFYSPITESEDLEETTNTIPQENLPFIVDESATPLPEPDQMELFGLSLEEAKSTICTIGAFENRTYGDLYNGAEKNLLPIILKNTTGTEREAVIKVILSDDSLRTACERQNISLN